MTEYTDKFCEGCDKQTTHENNQCLICAGAIKEETVDVEYNDIGI